jgi:ABC-type nitrate/sulfonate/bicarbonate transport system substrate-binding protein
VFSATAEVVPKFYYFNPDSTQVNFHDLQQEIKRFFQANGLAVEFQPFARFRDFDQQVKSARPAFLFLPSWYLDRPDAPKTITPLLIPVRQGRDTYVKLLIASKSSRIGAKDLARKTIALTSFASDEEALLDKILFHRLTVAAKEMSYVHVSKDLDALIAVAIHQVELAFVSRESMDRMAQVNPRLAAGVLALAESDPIPLPVLCYTPELVSPEQLQAFTRVVQQGQGDAQTRTINKILQIDDWKPIDK